MTERSATSPSRLAASPVLVAVLVVGLGLGLWLRATPQGAAFLFGDELHSLGALKLPWSRLFSRYDAVGSGLALPLMQKGLVAAFGASLPVIRAVAFVPSLALVAAVAWWARLEGGRPAAFVAALIVALAPVFVFYGHFARSYSLAALLCIGLQVVCRRSARAFRPEDATGSWAWRPALLIAGLGGLAVYVHLVSVFFLVALGAGLVVAMLARYDVRDVLRHPVVAGFAGATGLAAALHWPAIDSLLDFVGRKGEQAYHGGFGPFDVMLVLAGSPLGAALASLGLAAAAGSEVRARAFDAAPLVSATFAPALLLWIVSPYGDAYAYARYLLPSAAAGCVLLALGAVRAGSWMQVRLAGWPVELVGIGLASALFLCGPRGPLVPSLGPFANTYLGLVALPAFFDAPASAHSDPPQAHSDPSQALSDPPQAHSDPSQALSDPPQAHSDPSQALSDPPQALSAAPPADSEPPQALSAAPPAPDWYQQVAGTRPPLTLVEVPPLRNRAVHYLAALWRWHGQVVRMGTFGPIVAGAPRIESDLYVDLTRLASDPSPPFDALVVHRRISDEVERYWARVYAREPAGPTRALLERHRVYGHDLPSVGRGVVEDLESILGPPVHSDVDVVVWESTEARASRR